MVNIPRDNMEAIYAYLMLEGFKGKELAQGGDVLQAVDTLLVANDFDTQFNNDTMFSRTGLQNLYTAGKRTALGGRFGGRAVTYPYGYSLVRQGSSKDNDGFNQPTRNRKMSDFTRESSRITAQILNLASTGEITPEFQDQLNLGRESSLATGETSEVGQTGNIEETVVPEITIDEPDMIIAPPVEITGVKIKGATGYQGQFFIVPEAPTPDEQIALSLKAWNENQAPNKYWPYEGRLLFTLNPSSYDSEMQPTNAVVISEPAAQSDVDAFMNMDDFMDDTTETVAVINDNANEPFFLTPQIQFSFKMGESAYFRVVGGAGAEEYRVNKFPVRIADDEGAALVTDVQVAWAKPSGDFTGEDTAEAFVITLTQAGKEVALMWNGVELQIGPEDITNGSNDSTNTYGGMMTVIPAGEALIYPHGVKGFGGLLNKDDGEPIDTLVWSNLNASSAGLSGSVSVNAATDVPAVIRTQMSRFYGNSEISDPSLNWKSWGDNPDAILTPIAGGDNVIFNFDPQPVDVQVDVREYETYHPEYLAPKLLSLTLEKVDGKIPQETSATGVISPTDILDDEGEIEDVVWNQVLDIEVIGGNASEYFGSSSKKTFVLPGDEQHLKFKNTAGEVVDVPKGSIEYITYDKDSATTVEGTLVARGVRLYTTVGTIDIPTTQDTGELWLEDPNGKLVGGTIKGGELSPPAPVILVLNESANEAWNNRRLSRRREKQSDRFTNRDESGAVVTRSIAFKASPTSKDYFVLAETSEGFKVMKIDLNIRRD